mgnify:CR=1 FL=1
MKKVLLTSIALGAVLALSGVARADIKVGVAGPLTGPNAAFGAQLQKGAEQAAEDINAAGGIKALGGAKIEAMLGDAQSTPDGGNAEVEKMNSAGVSAVVGGYASGICLAASQTAQRAFDVYRGNKMNHAPAILVRSSAEAPWVRFDGFASVDQLLAELPRPTSSMAGR